MSCPVCGRELFHGGLCRHCERDLKDRDAVARRASEAAEEQARYAEEQARHAAQLSAQYAADRRSRGDCERCGKEFKESLRVFPRVGRKWTGPLERFTKLGVCPACYGLWGEEKRLEVEWTPDEWLRHNTARLERASTSAEALKLVGEFGPKWKDLARMASEKAAKLARAEAEAAAEKQRRDAEAEQERKKQAAKLEAEEKKRAADAEAEQKRQAAESAARKRIADEFDPDKLTALAAELRKDRPELAAEAAEKAKRQAAEWRTAHECLALFEKIAANEQAYALARSNREDARWPASLLAGFVTGAWFLVAGGSSSPWLTIMASVAAVVLVVSIWDSIPLKRPGSDQGQHTRRGVMVTYNTTCDYAYKRAGEPWVSIKKHVEIAREEERKFRSDLEYIDTST